MTLYDIKVLDDKISKELREEVWEYLKDQPWYCWVRKSRQLKRFVPRVDGYDFPLKQEKAIYGVTMPRTLFAVDEPDLREHHPVIYRLWNEINSALNNDYEINGIREDSATDWFPELFPEFKARDGGRGHRAYVNAQPKEWVKRSHGIHRDNINLEDDTKKTILYFANPEWYPSWFAENIFYSEDPEETTGDHQQHQNVTGISQNRGFKVGWPEKIVSPKPGRILAYDSRSLHTTRPASEWCPDDVMRLAVAFRAQKKACL